MTRLSIIIPAHNAEDFITSTLDTIVAAKLDTEIVVIDDASRDGTLAILRGYEARHDNVVVVSCPENVGAGAARNIGMRLAKGDYLYFLDADDILRADALEKCMQVVERTGCDVLSFKYDYMTSETGQTRQILRGDREIWDSITVKAGEAKAVSLVDSPRLLLLVNYPWNKIVRRDFAESSQLYFSRTYVNNDIYAHWHIYIKAASICMYNETLISHRVFDERSQITNVFDERRFDVFKALEDVERLMDQDEVARRRYYHFFLQFKLELLKWINGRLAPQLRETFLDLVRRSYGRFDQGLFLRCFDAAPGVAAESVALRFDPRSVLRR